MAPGVRRWPRAAGAALATLMLLAACTDPAREPPSGGTPSSSPVASPTPGTTFADDVRQAWTFYRSAHARPGFAEPLPRLRAAFEAFAARADGLGREEVLVGLMRLLARPGATGGRDGHSGIFPLDGHDPELSLYPLQLYRFPDGVVVVGADAANAHLVGAELVGVGDVSAAAALRLVEPLVPRDNRMTMLARSPQFLVTREVLVGLGLVGADDRSPFSFEVGGERVQPDLDPIPASDYAREHAAFTHPMVPPALPPAGTLPGDLPEQDWSWTYRSADDALVVRYDLTVADAGPLADELAPVLRRRDPGTVVVDLRRNPGGDNSTYGPFVDLLRGRRVVVLLGRSTFSAAGHLALDLARVADVTFAGEDSGFSANQFGDPVSVRLTASGLIVNAAAVWWRRAADRALTVRPAIRVDVTSRDHAAGRDPVLERVLAAA